MPKFILICLLTLAAPTHATLNIKITQSVEQALPIAIVPFDWSHAQQVAPIDLAAIVANDLASSGQFDVMDTQNMPQYPHSLDDVDFEAWHGLDMENVLIGNLSLTETGDYLVSFMLIDILRGKKIAGASKQLKLEALRYMAHEISDIVFEKLIGIPGAFSTRIAYVTATKGKTNKQYTLHISDADGHNPIILLKSKQPLMSPSWSPDAKKLAYVSFEEKSSAIYIQHITTGKRQRVASFSGINSAPAWSPDGTHLALTLSKDGNPEIYIMNLEFKSLRRITQNSAIDTEPSWSPDGRKLAFTSDRGGGPQIYEIDIHGRQAKRVSFEGNYNARPRYSPDGKSITMVHAVNGTYQIGILNIDSGYINVLTDTRLSESPSFSPNSNTIIYTTTRSNGTHLETVSVNGQVRTKLDLLQGDVREPAWSPFLD